MTPLLLCRTLEPPKMLWSESKDKYIDKTMYRDTVPADKKKNGFMSSDFPRRDEFSNTIRTSQLREILKVSRRKARRVGQPVQQSACRWQATQLFSALPTEQVGQPSHGLSHGL